jgi:hypothetical protein
MSVATEIKSTLESALPDATVIAEDLTAGGAIFEWWWFLPNLRAKA